MQHHFLPVSYKSDLRPHLRRTPFAALTRGNVMRKWIGDDQIQSRHAPPSEMKHQRNCEGG
ncbi:hypothetical protein RSSM_01264 [Rhodopirellula sallentina SM41]|uniref:Uncharacterized protein n=1 Tax=Rhodopirellula sallentina SM41 TaxID=1263870 RepID=M5U723_9BACT|nr:hypothetical protein RSSM_01264 [Rhodopirellula sallentina SM41]